MNTKLLATGLSGINGSENKIFRNRKTFLRRTTKFVENNLLKIITYSFLILIAKEIGLASYHYLWHQGYFH